MRFGNYSVQIPEGTEKDSGYVGMEHGKQYTIRIGNQCHRQCDAEVSIDGKQIGVFRLQGYQTMILERSPEDDGRFTFYSSGTSDAEKAGEASVSNEEKGLVKVRFVPEKPRQQPVLRSRGFGQGITTQSMGGGMPAFPGAEMKTSGGITGLSGSSAQRFVDVGPIDRDEFAAVTITLRLVTANTGPRPLMASRSVGNAVPPPVC